MTALLNWIQKLEHFTSSVGSITDVYTQWTFN